MIVFGMLASFGLLLIILIGYIKIEFRKVTKTGVVIFPRREIKNLLHFGAAYIGIISIGSLIFRFFF